MVIDMDDELEQLKRMDQADRASWIDELRRRISPKSRLEPEKMLSTIQSLKKLVEPVASEPIDLPEVAGQGQRLDGQLNAPPRVAVASPPC